MDVRHWSSVCRKFHDQFHEDIKPAPGLFVYSLVRNDVDVCVVDCFGLEPDPQWLHKDMLSSVLRTYWINVFHSIHCGNSGCLINRDLEVRFWRKTFLTGFFASLERCYVAFCVVWWICIAMSVLEDQENGDAMWIVLRRWKSSSVLHSFIRVCTANCIWCLYIL